MTASECLYYRQAEGVDVRLCCLRSPMFQILIEEYIRRAERHSGLAANIACCSILGWSRERAQAEIRQ